MKLDKLQKNVKNFLNEKKSIFIFFLCFAIFTFPRSLEVTNPKLYDIVNISKVICGIFILIYTVISKIKLSKYTKGVIVYSVYLLMATLFNNINIITYFKVYVLNISMVLLCDISLKKKYKIKMLKILSNYFYILIILNLLGLIFNFINSGSFISIENNYFLGQDNRFILYIIPTLIGFLYLYEITMERKYLIRFIMSYIISLSMLIALWAVASFGVLIFIGIGLIVFYLFRHIKINVYKVSVALLILCVAIVFFKVQNLFEYFIVNILHKSLTLSYRTIMWDDAKEMLINSPINLIFGFGYFDTKDAFVHMPLKMNHLHNIVMDIIFAGGIIGGVLYFRNLIIVQESLNKIKNNQIKNNTILFFETLMLLLIFDTFEMYQIYYLIICLMYYSSTLIIDLEGENMQNYDEEGIKMQKDKVGIMLATYNGEKYIKDQIDSIINQTYKNWVLYVSDDNSSDNTINIVNEYKEKYEDKIIILENENKFSNAKLNFANLFDKVDGMDYYMFCDQDDVWTKDKIQNLLIPVKKEEKDGKKPILAYCDSKIVDSNLNVISESLVEYGNKHLPNKHLMEHVLIENYFPGCAVLFNKELKEKTKTIYKDCEMHDWWLTLTSALSGKIIFVDKKLHYYRQHGNNTVGAHKDDNAVNKIIIRIKKLFDLKTTKTTWSTYQDTVLKQANELYRIYSKDETIDSNNIEIIKKFIDIMNDKNRLRRLILLIKKNYVPVEKIRVLRLVL